METRVTLSENDYCCAVFILCRDFVLALLYDRFRGVVGPALGLRGIVLLIYERFLDVGVDNVFNLILYVVEWLAVHLGRLIFGKLFNY